MGYYIAYICKNGHIDSADDKPHNTRCLKCGEDIICRCENCGTAIRGNGYDDDFSFKRYDLPYYCGYCGEPFPWTTALTERVMYALSLDADITDDTREIISKALPDLIAEGIMTPMAIAEYKIGAAKVSETIQNTLHDILVSVVSDSIAKKLFG